MRRFVSVIFDFRRGLITSAVRMVLVVRRQVSAEDMTAASRAAITNPLRPTGIVCMISAGNALSAGIPGRITRAVIPINVTKKAIGIMVIAAIMTERFATSELLEQNILE